MKGDDISADVMNFLTRVFRAYGQLCASCPWEVIIGTLTTTVCMMSMTLFTTAESSRICGWNYKCEQATSAAATDLDDKNSDVIILTITRCLAVVYLYTQFTSVRKLHSKYLLGIAGVFTIFSSFVFIVGVINIFGTDLTGLNEALPFFLILVDLSKACTLAKFALSSKTEDEVVDNIGRGMALLGPMITLDSLVETLVIAIGTMSGVKALETVCRFGCLSIITNYFAFMTFYPACLALFLEMSRGSRHLEQLQQTLSKVWNLSEEEEKPNPVTQRVKVVMSAGLLAVHAHSHWAASGGTMADDNGVAADVVSAAPELTRTLLPDIPFWQFYHRQLTSVSIGCILMFGPLAILVIKCIVFDVVEDEKDDNDNPQSVAVSDCLAATELPEFTAAPVIENDLDVSTVCIDLKKHFPTEMKTRNVEHVMVDDDVATEYSSEPEQQTIGKTVSFAAIMISQETQTEQLHCKSVKFKVGGDDSSDDLDTEDDEPAMTSNRCSLMVSDETQTESEPLTAAGYHPDHSVPICWPPRPLQECLTILKAEDGGASKLSDDEILLLIANKHIAAFQLETAVEDHLRGVMIRRRLVAKSLPSETIMEKLPFTNYDYKYVHGSCCENVVGYIPVPVGVVGPLQLDGKLYTVPMATTEGCLLASTNRGCRALLTSGGVTSVITQDGMTRAPVVRFGCARRANDAKLWLEDEENYSLVAEAFNSTSRYARVCSIRVKQVARSLHLRFTAFTGDAMGMNMVSKGCEKALTVLKEAFPDMEILSLSGNFCTDKKPSAINWVEGRGKSVVCDAIVLAQIVRDVLKTSAAALVDLNTQKNLMGSAIAGSIGGFNAHAANVVTAIYIATGQDPAQNVCSSNCMTVMETTGPLHEDLYISCTMPCIEVGTIGGGTILPPQAACLEMLGVSGSNADSPGANAQRLARIVCGTVMAAELSLMAALTTGDLVKSHLKHNRSVINMAPVTDSTLVANSRSIPADISLIPGTCLKS